VKYIGLKSFALASGIFGVVLNAQAAHVVYSPIVEPGEVEVEVMSDYINDSDHEEDGVRVDRLEVAYGAGQRWMTELLVEYETPDGEATFGEAVEWENVFQMSEQGEYSFDWGLFFELEKALEDDHPDEVIGGFLIQKEFGDLVSIANILFEREFGDNAEGELEGLFSGQLRWRMNKKLEPTLEIYSSEYSNTLGTLINGKVPAAGGKFGYSLGVLWGLDDDTPDQTLRAGIELEF